jgi:hypothetical protein
VRPDPNAARPGTIARPRQIARTPFILLVLGLLGGGLICLLVINTTLAASSFEITRLRQAIVTKSQREQVLQQQVSQDQTPGAIERRAWKLGLRPQQVLTFLDLKTHRIYRQKSSVPGLLYTPPGYTP